jgi:hypothetical protein
MLVTMFLVGLVTAFNLLIIKWKLGRGRYGDVALDAISLVILSALFGNTLGGFVITMVASLCISLYLMVSPPRFYS